MKAHDRHFAYSAPSFGGDSGGGIIFRGGKLLESIYWRLTKLLSCKDLNLFDEETAAKSELVSHFDSENWLETLSSGALAIYVSSTMAAHSSKD